LIFAWASANEGGLAVIAVLLFLPVAQLGASVFTFIWIAIRGADFPDRNASLQMAGRITIWSILGALAGGLVMIFGFKAFH
jgi:hypothetical protein